MLMIRHRNALPHHPVVRPVVSNLDVFLGVVVHAELHGEHVLLAEFLVLKTPLDDGAIDAAKLLRNLAQRPSLREAGADQGGVFRGADRRHNSAHRHDCRECATQKG